MNRRGFLSALFKGTAVVAVVPQIVTHGLHLRKRLIEPVFLDYRADALGIRAQLQTCRRWRLTDANYDAFLKSVFESRPVSDEITMMTDRETALRFKNQYKKDVVDSDDEA